MENNLKIHHNLTRLTPTKRVESVGPRQNGSQQNSFKESHQKKSKKKSDKAEKIKRSSSLHRTPATAKNPRKKDTVETIVKTSFNRTIDITV